MVQFWSELFDAQGLKAALAEKQIKGRIVVLFLGDLQNHRHFFQCRDFQSRRLPWGGNARQKATQGLKTFQLARAALMSAVCLGLSFGFSLAGTSVLHAEMVVENNKIYIGSDYSVFRIKAGERRKCSRACEKDRRCLAWTIVKPGNKPYGECRLKREVSLELKNNCCISGKKTDDFRGNANKKGKKKQIAFCDKWAAKSTELNELNERRGCGYRGRAWHSNSDRHFRHCMKLKRKGLAAERQGQQRAINTCLSELDYSKKARCDHYGRIAIAQNASRVKAGCDVSNRGRWSRNIKDHIQFCLGAGIREIAVEQDAREKRLQSCFSFEARGSGPCDVYAKTAISHFRKNIQKGCDLHGDAWHNNYRRHLSFCRQNSPKQRARAQKRRRLTLKTCRLFGKFGIQWR